MGLDSLELILAIETKFNLDIPDADAQEMITVGAMYDFVHRELARRAQATGEVLPNEGRLRNEVLDIYRR